MIKTKASRMVSVSGMLLECLLPKLAFTTSVYDINMVIYSVIIFTKILSNKLTRFFSVHSEEISSIKILYD